MRRVLLALVLGTIGSSAWAFPGMVPGHPTSTGSDDIIDVKIVCAEDGQCVRPPGRKPIAYWVYGDKTFLGPVPYTKPGYYGPPEGHWRWIPLFTWWP